MASELQMAAEALRAAFKDASATMVGLHRIAARARNAAALAARVSIGPGAVRPDVEALLEAAAKSDAAAHRLREAAAKAERWIRQHVASTAGVAVSPAQAGGSPGESVRAAAIGWLNKADFSSGRTMNKKFDAHGSVFGFGKEANRNKETFEQFREAIKGHIESSETRMFRFNYRGQGVAVGFIDPNTLKMVMLRASTGAFWTAYRLEYHQFFDVVDNNHLW